MKHSYTRCTRVKRMCVCWLVSWETLARAVVTTAYSVLHVRTVPQRGPSPALWAPTSVTQPFITHSESVSNALSDRDSPSPLPVWLG